MVNNCFRRCLLFQQTAEFYKSNRNLCPFCSVPMMILNPDGNAFKINETFKHFWQIDPEKILRQPGYNIFKDPHFQDNMSVNRLKKAFTGRATRLEVSDYDLPLEFHHSNRKRGNPESFTICMNLCHKGNNGNYIMLRYCKEHFHEVTRDPNGQRKRVTVSSESIIDLKHEINNPLLLIIGHAQLILSKSDMDDNERSYKLEKILANAERIRRTIERFQSDHSDPIPEAAFELHQQE